MSDSHRFRPSSDSRPSPYPFLDRARKNHFLKLVREQLGKAGAAVTIADGVARVAGNPMAHGLLNLAQTCNLLPETNWREIIAEHFAKSEPALLRANAMSLIEGGFERNVDRLVVRIYSSGHFTGPLTDHFVQRIDLPETSTVLAIDVGTSMIPVPRPVAATWCVPDCALFEHALGNLVRTSKAHWSRLSIPVTDFGFDLLHGDFHAATHVLRRDPGLPRVGREGNLIGIPACGVLFSYPIDAALDALTLESLTAMSLGKCHDGPNAITPHLFWRTPRGEFHLQRAMRHGRGTRFLPSPEFVECMVRLQKARGGGASP
jgi:hypothetical protein